jgi:hypothetical protein
MAPHASNDWAVALAAFSVRTGSAPPTTGLSLDAGIARHLSHWTPCGISAGSSPASAT